jgi:hypothetical protein
MQHDWGPSMVGHGDAQCRRCFVTNREAMAIGMLQCEPVILSSRETKPTTTMIITSTEGNVIHLQRVELP